MVEEPFADIHHLNRTAKGTVYTVSGRNLTEVVHVINAEHGQLYEVRTSGFKRAERLQLTTTCAHYKVPLVFF